MSDEPEIGGELWGLLKRVSVGRNPRHTLLRVAILAVVSYAIFGHLLLPVRIEGISMWPTYRDRQINLANRLAFLWRKPQRGDVVCLQLAAGRHVMYMKRIIGLPGETIEFRRGQAFANGQALDEPYVKTDCRWDLPPKHLGPDEYYVVGDNRGMPAGLHEQGAVARRLIVGKPLL